MRVCADCHELFHTTGGTCIDWPCPQPSERKRLITMLKQGMSSKVRLFIEVVRRLGFMHEDGRIYFVITALQRGDFHKFKWSIGAEPHHFALLPLNESYSDEWLKDMFDRAEALEQVAAGRWQFIHSSLVISRRDKAGKAMGTGYVLSGLAKSKLSVNIALTKDDYESWRAFTTWAEGEERKSTLYNIDTLVPFYNSPRVLQWRTSFLDVPPVGTVRPLPCDDLLAGLTRKVKDMPVLVLWGTRTGRHRDYLNPNVVAREFRHKTSKSLVRHLLDEVRGKKICILAGEPLRGMEADIDLTMLWSAKEMKERFGIDCSFSRLEQEYIFFHLAQIAANTLHIGMQSGNIEPLINNPRTNVICVNESSSGGAGLSNVEKISGARHDLTMRGRLEGNNLPSNLYLSFNLKVLPSAIGELTRRLMEKNEENVTMKHGLQKLVQEIAAIFGETVDVSELSIEELFAYAGSLLESRTEEQMKKRAPVDLLTTDHEHELEQILFYFYDKIHPRRSKLEKAKRGPRVILRTEIRLLCVLAASSLPRVQFAIHVLNNELTAPVPSAREHAIRFAIAHVENLKLMTDYKNAHRGDLHKLPKDAELRLKTLLETLQAAIDESSDEDLRLNALSDLENIKKILENGETMRLGKKKIRPVKNTRERLLEAWNRLRPLEFDAEDEKELYLVREILEAELGFELGLERSQVFPS